MLSAYGRLAELPGGMREPGVLVEASRVVPPDLLVEDEHVLVHERRAEADDVNRAAYCLDLCHVQTVTCDRTGR